MTAVRVNERIYTDFPRLSDQEVQALNTASSLPALSF
jgi:hypothetical protein